MGQKLFLLKMTIETIAKNLMVSIKILFCIIPGEKNMESPAQNTIENLIDVLVILRIVLV